MRTTPQVIRLVWLWNSYTFFTDTLLTSQHDTTHLVRVLPNPPEVATYISKDTQSLFIAVCPIRVGSDNREPFPHTKSPCYQDVEGMLIWTLNVSLANAYLSPNTYVPLNFLTLLLHSPLNTLSWITSSHLLFLTGFLHCMYYHVLWNWYIPFSTWYEHYTNSNGIRYCTGFAYKDLPL